MSEGARLCGNCFFEVTDESAAHCPRCGHDLGPGPYTDTLPVGSILNGRYVIGRALGQGGFGITYKALDHKTGDIVAVKEYFPDKLCRRGTETQSITVSASGTDDDFYYGRERFLREAETLAGLGEIPGIIHVHEYFEENGTAYFSMDYVEGQDLKQYLKEHGGRLRWKELSNIVYPVMSALDEVHKRGIVHRDISPDNIYVKADGEAVLLDFGAARASLGEKSKSISVILKPGFAPKEQYFSRGKQGPFTDVYAMGATIYRCLTGEEPPESLERSEALGAGEADPLKPIHDYAPIDAGVEAAVLKAMSVDAQDRFQTMGAFEDALKKADNGPHPGPTPGPISVDPTRLVHKPSDGNGGAGKKGGPTLSRRALIGIGCGVAAAAVVGIAVAATRSDPDPSPNPDPSNNTNENTNSNTSNSGSSSSKGKGLALDQAYAVLYSDGELVFQEGEDTEDGREVLHAGSFDIDDPWWIGKADTLTIGGDGTEHEGDWCDQVQRITSATDIYVPDLSKNSGGSIVSFSEDTDLGLFHCCVNLTDISGVASWDISQAKDLSNMFSLCTSLSDVSPLASWDLSPITSINSMFANCRTLSDISPLADWDVSSVKDMGAVFQSCYELTDISPLRGWDVSSARSTQVMFNACPYLKDISPLAAWDMSSVQNIYGMFAVCQSLTDISPLAGWKLSSVTSIKGLFKDCEALRDISPLSGWDVSQVTDMSQLFSGCSVLNDISSLSGWDVGSVTDMSTMFFSCTALKDIAALSGWKTSSVTSMNQLFDGCSLLDNVSAVSSWDVSSVTNIGSVFSDCPITDTSALSSWDVSRVTGFNGLFQNCTRLADVSGISSWDVSSGSNFGWMFNGCQALTDASPIAGWSVASGASMTDMFDNCPATPPSWYHSES